MSYWDGTSATYQYGTSYGTMVALLSATDTKAVAAMRSVEWSYAGAYMMPPNNTTLAWVEVASEKLPGGPVVSTRTVPVRNSKKWIEGRPFMARQVTETRGDGATRTFTADAYTGRLVSMTDFRGNVTSYEYGYMVPSTYPTKITDALGRVTNLTLDYTVDCRPVTITNPDSTYRQYTWFNKSFLATVRDERGGVTTYTRDSSNRITRIDYPDGAYETYSYGAYNKLTQTRNRNGSVNYFEYDARGNLFRYWPATFAAKSTSIPYFEYAYYSDGHAWEDRVQTERDPRGNVTTYEYNARGQVTKVSHADGNYLSYGYDDYGNKIWEENELRQRTSYTYDAYNRVLTVTDPLNRVTQTSYTAPSGAAELSHTSNSPRYIYTADGNATAYSYDNDWRKTEETRGALTSEAARTRFSYDAVGNLSLKRVEYQSNTWRDTTYSYDSRNRRRYEYAPLSRTTEWRYDAAGNVTTLVNPDGTTRSKTFDSMNRPLTETDERNYTTTYTYYPSGKVNTITDARGSVHSHTYDAANRLLFRNYPGGSAESWTYDAVGSPATYTNRSGQILRYTYDNRNRETYHAWDGTAAPAVSTGYDAASRVTSRSNTNSTLGYGFDAAGQLTTASQANAGGPSVTSTYDYDSVGQRTSFMTTFYTWVLYTWNARHELSQLQQWSGNAPFTWSSYTRDLSGAPTSQWYYSGVRDDHTYDGAGRVNYRATIRNSDGANLLLRRFGYDTRDRRTWSLRNDAYGDTYEYLADSQLYRYRYEVYRPDQNFWNTAGWTDTFAYDAVGNRTSINENGTTTSYTANSLNQYTAITGATTGYDSRGNLTTYNEWTYAYDADNRLTSAAKSGYAVQFYYDPEGRLSKVNRNGSWEHRYYDGTQCFFRCQPSGTWIDFMIWGPTPDELNARWDASHGGWSFFSRDPIKSPDVATDIYGNVVERYLYDPYGLPDIRDASWGARHGCLIRSR